MKRVVSLFALLLFLPLYAAFCLEPTDSPHWNIRAFTAPEDLPNEVVRDVIMTKDGSVWLATWGGGIVVMNGTEKRIINTENGLISNDVRVLEEDREGRVWVGTSEGISCIQDQEIINFPTIPLPEIPANDSLFSIESIHNGEVWFGDGFGNLFAWIPASNSPDVRKGRWKHLYNFNTDWPEKNVEKYEYGWPGKSDGNVSVRQITQYKDYSIWIAAIGLVKTKDYDNIIFNAIGGSPYCFDFIILNPIKAIATGRWELVEGEVNYKIVKHYSSPSDPKCLLSAFGKTFVGTERGLYIFEGDRFIPFYLTPDKQLFLIESLSLLPDNSLWVGTRTGVFRISQPSWMPQRFTPEEAFLFNENQHPEYKNKVWALDHSGRLWTRKDQVWENPFSIYPSILPAFSFHAYSEKLFVREMDEIVEFDAARFQIKKNYNIEDLEIGEKNRELLLNENEIWIPTSNGVMKISNDSIAPVFNIPSDINQETYTILQSAPDDYWIGGKGWLGRYRNRQFEIQTLPPEYQDSNSSFMSSLKTKEGELWFALLGEGLLRLKDTQWSKINRDNGLPSNNAWTLIQSRDGTIWAGDRVNGVMSYKDGRWIHYDYADGLPLGTVRAVVEDEDGAIWIGIRRKALDEEKDEELLYEYHPDRNPPAVQMISASDRLVPAAPGVFSFLGYDAWNDTPRDELVYSWRVLQPKKGKTIHDWNLYTTKNSALVPPLPPGDYLFEVRVQDRHRNTSPVNANAAFVVEPYLWMNPYYQLTTVITFISIVLSIYLLWMRYKLKMESKLLQEKIGFSDFCDKTHIGVLRLSPEGEIRYVNRAMAEICGFESETQMRDHPDPLQWSHPKQFHQFLRAFEDDNASQFIQLIGLQPDTGKEFFVMLYGSKKDNDREIMALDLSVQKSLENEVIQISTKQQHKISMELHDGIKQELTGISHRIQLLIQQSKSSYGSMVKDMEELYQLIQGACKKTQQLSKSLSPLLLEVLDLKTSLLELQFDLQNHYPDYQYSFQILPDFPNLDKKVELNLWYIARNALYNAAKHSQAKTIELTTGLEDHTLILIVKDDGIGFSLSEKTTGMGIQNMRSRASSIFADLKIVTTPNVGTLVRCRCPLDL